MVSRPCSACGGAIDGRHDRAEGHCGPCSERLGLLRPIRPRRRKIPSTRMPQRIYAPQPARITQVERDGE
jgi:hypothetical protein